MSEISKIVQHWTGSNSRPMNGSPRRAPGIPSPQRQLIQWEVAGEEFILGEHLTIERILGSGAYGLVCEVSDKNSHERYAVKKCKNVFNSHSIALRTLREVRLLRNLKHDRIIKLYEIYPPENCESFNDIYVSFELMEADLSKIIRSPQALTDAHYQYFMAQLLSALVYLHDSHVFHRDLKPKNLLINSNCVLKIADFGLAKFQYSDRSITNMTDYVTTRWYRAPEILSGSRKYNEAVDTWSVGTIFAELLGRVPLFPGQNSANQLEIIVAILGSPPQSFIDSCCSHKCTPFVRSLCNPEPKILTELFPAANPDAIDLLTSFLRFDPGLRLTASDALKHPYFQNVLKDGFVHMKCAPNIPHLKAEFEFENRRPTIQTIRDELLREVEILSGGHFARSTKRQKGESKDFLPPRPPSLPPRAAPTPSPPYEEHKGAGAISGGTIMKTRHEREFDETNIMGKTAGMNGVEKVSPTHHCTIC